MNKTEISKKISTFRDIYNHFGGTIGFYIKDKKIYFFVENSKFGTPNEIKLKKYDFLYYFTDKIYLPISLLTEEILNIIKQQHNLL